MTLCVCEFHITCRLLSWASGWGDAKSQSRFHNMSVSHSHDDGTINSTQSIILLQYHMYTYTGSPIAFCGMLLVYIYTVLIEHIRYKKQGLDSGCCEIWNKHRRVQSLHQITALHVKYSPKDNLHIAWFHMSVSEVRFCLLEVCMNLYIDCFQKLSRLFMIILPRHTHKIALPEPGHF